MSINTVTVSGNLTKDSELKQTKGGNLLSGSICVNERVKDADGNWTDKPCYIDWTLFGPRANKLVGYLTKGAKVCIDGFLTYDSWTDKDGNNRNKLSIIVREVVFFRPSNVVMDQQAAIQAAQQPYQQTQQYQQPQPQQYQQPQPQPQPQYQVMQVAPEQAAAMQQAAYAQYQQGQQPIHY